MILFKGKLSIEMHFSLLDFQSANRGQRWNTVSVYQRFRPCLLSNPSAKYSCKLEFIWRLCIQFIAVVLPQGRTFTTQPMNGTTTDDTDDLNVKLSKPLSLDLHSQKFPEISIIEQYLIVRNQTHATLASNR